MSTKSTSIFSKDYWKQSMDNCKSVKMIALVALFIAVRTVLNYFRIPVGENLNFYFTFLITALGGAIFGPVLAFIFGAIYDIVSFLMYPDGTFFVGYTLQAGLAAMIYALFLYRKKYTILRLGLCKLTVNVTCNILLGAYLSSLLYSKGYIYYMMKSIVKNLALLPIEIALLVIVFKAMIPFLEKKHYIEPQDEKMKWF